MTTDQQKIDKPVLATDLDGTLIPLDGDQQNIADLQLLTSLCAERAVQLVFVTGRHFSSVQNAITLFNLPVPDIIICDVGTSLYRRTAADTFAADQNYVRRMQAAVDGGADHSLTDTPPPQRRVNRAMLLQLLKSRDELTLQEDAKQGTWKLSYYANAADLPTTVPQLRALLQQNQAGWTLIESVDPFNGDGLIDFLPAGVSKAFALEWLVDSSGAARESIVFAGDSGNDMAAFTAGFRTIVVGNTDRRVCSEVEQFHRSAEWTDRLCLASASATSGVLEGCRFFGLV